MRHPAIAAVAKRLEVDPGQVALAWVLRNENVMAIPKATSREHVLANRGAADIHLDRAALDVLEQSFPAPRRKRPLDMI